MTNPGAQSPRYLIALDLVVTPTTPIPPFTVSELLADPDHLRAKEVVSSPNTRPFNLLGLPAVSIPCGFTSKGLPIGMQIIGRPDDEATVLRLARLRASHGLAQPQTEPGMRLSLFHFLSQPVVPVKPTCDLYL
jgi:Asp-tRNA(Asn)/Glu-tRNA(Gln) amidotransferase A subunit family amidase